MGGLAQNAKTYLDALEIVAESEVAEEVEEEEIKEEGKAGEAEE